MRFKIGDKVRIIGDSNDRHDSRKGLYGKTGKIVRIDEFYPYPYFIQLDDDILNVNYDGIRTSRWVWRDLELAYHNINKRVS